MLSESVVHEVKSLLERNHSRREIARLAGVSTDSVRRIANGSLKGKEEPLGVCRSNIHESLADRRARKLRELDELLGIKPDDSTGTGSSCNTGEDTEAPVERCPSCGGLVCPPCVLCAIRNSKGSPNCNIEVASPDRVFEALKLVTAASHTAIDDADTVDKEHWELTEKGSTIVANPEKPAEEPGPKPAYVPTPDEIKQKCTQIRKRRAAVV